jgi:CMP-N,N'-diacetyllegionaminic acid synthase
MSGTPSVVALIPARAGSKRIADKNIALLNEHPLIAYTICAARKSGVFGAVLVSTDSDRYAAIARHYGADVPGLRPVEFSGELADGGQSYDAFSLLRPTSPCRKPETIRRAWTQFLEERDADSLRAVEKCEQHPGKMWVIDGTRMRPFAPQGPGPAPYHSMQYAALPPVYVQNASLEIAWTRVPLEMDSIAGEVLTPFLTERDEGFDVNRPRDWRLLEMALERGEATLPEVDRPPFAD